MFVKHTLTRPAAPAGLLCASPLVCVPLSTISFCPQDESEEVEANDDKEEAEEEEGRSNGFQPSMRTPLAVISHG